MNTTPLNGSDRQVRGAMSNMAHFLRDLVSLFELQGVLLAVEAGDGFRKVRHGILGAIVLTALGLSCIPLGMAGLALCIAENSQLSIAQSLLTVAIAGLVIASAGIYLIVGSLKSGTGMLPRSRTEWRCNVEWIKETLRHMGNRNPPVKTFGERTQR